MPIDMNKPQPLTINGQPHFTLTDYEPGDVTVTRPRITDSDITFEIQRLLFPHNMEEKDLSDDWVKKNFPFKTVDEFKNGVRAHMERSAAMAVEKAKNDQVLANMAQKLEQAVPKDMVEHMKQNILDGVANDAKRMNISESELRGAMGLTDDQLDEIALHNAESKAALLAYVDEKKIKAEEKDVEAMVGNKEAADQLISEARKQNQYDNLLKDIATTKAHQELAREARVTYDIESIEAASTRAKEYEKILEEMKTQMAAQKTAAQAEAAAEKKAAENAKKQK